MNSMKIGTHQMDAEFGLYLPHYTIPAPVPQTKFINIIGRDGAVDLSNAFGDIHYNSREWVLEFKHFDPVNWQTISSQVFNAIHGQRLDFTFDDDPDWFWTGRFIVNSYSSQSGEGTLKVTVTADPYKYKKLTHTVTSSVPTTQTTLTGNLISVNNTKHYKPSSVTVTGVSEPTIYRTGTNLCRVARTYTSTSQGITYSENEFGTVHCVGTATAESVSAGAPNAAYADARCLYTLPAGTYTISNVGTIRVYVSFRNAANTDNLLSSRTVRAGANYTFTVSDPVIVYIRADILTGETVYADVLCMVTAGSTAATSYEPWVMGTYTTTQFTANPLLDGQNNIWSEAETTVVLDEPITLNNVGSKPVVPTVTSSSAMTLSWDGYTYSKQSGVSVIPQLVLPYGNTYLYADGNGVISFAYSEGSL